MTKCPPWKHAHGWGQPICTREPSCQPSCPRSDRGEHWWNKATGICCLCDIEFGSWGAKEQPSRSDDVNDDVVQGMLQEGAGRLCLAAQWPYDRCIEVLREERGDYDKAAVRIETERFDAIGYATSIGKVHQQPDMDPEAPWRARSSMDLAMKAAADALPTDAADEKLVAAAVAAKMSEPAKPMPSTEFVLRMREAQERAEQRADRAEAALAALKAADTPREKPGPGVADVIRVGQAFDVGRAADHGRVLGALSALIAERDAMRRGMALLISEFHWSQELRRHGSLSLDSEEDRNTLAGYIAAAVARVLRGEP